MPNVTDQQLTRTSLVRDLYSISAQIQAEFQSHWQGNKLARSVKYISTVKSSQT